MKKQRLCALFTAILLCLPHAGTAQKVPGAVLLVYMVGADLETHGGAASADLAEMIRAYPAGGGVQVLVCAGGAKRWQCGIAPETPTIYSLDENGLHKRMALGTGSMGAPESLQAFLSYANICYSDSRAALVLWNHGNGPLGGFGKDELHGGDELTLPELRMALSQSPYCAENPLEWIGFDACLMGSVETAALVAPYARYMLASEELEPSIGWDYSFLTLMDDGLSTPELAEQILKRFYTAVKQTYKNVYESHNGGMPYQGNYEEMLPVTLACYDLAEMQPLLTALDEFSHKMSTSLAFGGFRTFALARKDVLDVGKVSDNTQNDLVDLRQMVQSVAGLYPDQAQAVLSALSAFVPQMVTNNPVYSGVSVYFPYWNKRDYRAEYAGTYGEIAFSRAYESFIARFAQEWLTAAKEVKQPLYVSQTKNGLTIELDKEHMNEYAHASGAIFIEINGKFALYHIGGQANKQNGSLHVEFDPVTAYVVQGGEETPLPMAYQRENEQYRFYESWGMLKWVGDHKNLPTMQNITMQIAVHKESKQATLVGAYPSDMPTVGKLDLSLEGWTALEIDFFLKKPTYDENGCVMPYSAWTGSDIVGVWVELDEPFQIVMKPTEECSRPLYALIALKDIYTNYIGGQFIPFAQ